MRVLAVLLALPMLACTGGGSLPEPADLYGDWTGEADGSTRAFHFAATADGTHPDLVGMQDIYVLSRDGVEVQDGTFAIDRVPLTELGGEEGDALVTNVVTGEGAGQQFGNRLIEWTGDSFTIPASTSTGQLTFTRL